MCVFSIYVDRNISEYVFATFPCQTIILEVIFLAKSFDLWCTCIHPPLPHFVVLQDRTLKKNKEKGIFCVFPTLDSP